MANQTTSAVYHLGFQDRFSPGRLVHVEDHPGGWADIYLHALDVRNPLVSEFNRVTRHLVGCGLWRQRWTDDGRMQQAPRGLGIALSAWEIVPGNEMPRGYQVFPVEQDGSCIWLIRAGACTTALVDEMNAMLDRIAGDGLWLQGWYKRPGDEAWPSPVPSLSPWATPVPA